jgi:hypothetical protein
VAQVVAGLNLQLTLETVQTSCFKLRNITFDCATGPTAVYQMTVYQPLFGSACQLTSVPRLITSAENNSGTSANGPSDGSSSSSSSSGLSTTSAVLIAVCACLAVVCAVLVVKHRMNKRSSGSGSASDGSAARGNGDSLSYPLMQDSSQDV